MRHTSARRAPQATRDRLTPAGRSRVRSSFADPPPDPGDGRVLCETCRTYVRLRADGTLRAHRRAGIPCPAAAGRVSGRAHDLCPEHGENRPRYGEGRYRYACGCPTSTD